MLKRKLFKNPKIREKIFIIALIAIPLIHFGVFWMYVNVKTIINTFYRWNIMTGEMEWYGIKRYVDMFNYYVLGKDGHIAEYNVFWNSFKAIAINLIIFPIAIIASYSFYKKIPHQKYFRICFYLPSLISISVLAIVYRNMFHADFGPITMLYKLFHGGLSPEFLSNSSEHMWSLIFVFCIWAGLSSNVIMISGAMLRIPSDISEYARIEGVGFWRELFQIVLPLVMPTVGVYIINIFVSVFSFTLQPMMIAQVTGVDNQFMTVGWFIFNSVQYGTEAGMLQASTLGMILTIIMLPIIITLRVVIKKLTPDVQF